MAEATPDGYASELRREILRSEIQRVQVLAVVLASLLVVTLTASSLLTDLVHRLFRGGLAWWQSGAFNGAFAAYEDGFSALELSRKYYREAGLDVRQLDQLIR